jgi:hypothetical protein
LREGSKKAMNAWMLGREYGSSQGAVRYEVFGTGPPLVLVHGTPFSSYVWRKVAPALAETNTVYAFDLPGYGSSEKREGQDVSLAAQGRKLKPPLRVEVLVTTIEEGKGRKQEGKGGPSSGVCAFSTREDGGTQETLASAPRTIVPRARHFPMGE